MTFLVTLGEGWVEDSGEIVESDTWEYIACCDSACGHRALTECGFDVDFSDGLAGLVSGEAQRYTDGRETGKVSTASYGYWPCFDSPYDTFCVCGVQTAEGNEEEL